MVLLFGSDCFTVSIRFETFVFLFKTLPGYGINLSRDSMTVPLRIPSTAIGAYAVASMCVCVY